MDTATSVSSVPPSNTSTATGSPGNQPPQSSFGSGNFKRVLVLLAIAGIVAGGYVWYASRPEPISRTPQAQVPANRNSAQPAATPAPSETPAVPATNASN